MQPRSQLFATSEHKVRFVGVDEIGLMDGFAFVSANLQFLSLEYQLLQYLQVPICGLYVLEDENGACPDDGVYEFYMPFVLPEEERHSWLASGWEGASDVSFYSEANNVESLIGSCQLHFATAVTPSENTLLAKLPVPTAKVTLLSVLAFTALLVLSCVYQLVRDIAFGKKNKKNHEASSDDDNTLLSTDFTRLSK